MGIPFSAGLQFLFDSHQRFVRAGSPVYLRVKNFQEQGDYLEVGVPFVPTGAALAQTGYTDILIDPPPDVEHVTYHNVGLLAARLNFGSRVFLISNTWVEAQKQALGIEDAYAVFRARDGFQAIGLFDGKKIFSIEAITHTTVSATSLVWKIVANALEIEGDSTSL